MKKNKNGRVIRVSETAYQKIKKIAKTTQRNLKNTIDIMVEKFKK